MTLFYRLIMGDSREMTGVRDNSIDLTVCSPPYWFLAVFSDARTDVLRGDLSRIENEFEFYGELGKVWREVYRVTRHGGYLVVEFEDIPVGSRIYGYPREILVAGKMHESVERAGWYLIARWYWKKFKAGAAVQKFQYLMYPNLEDSDVRAVSNLAYCFVYKKRELVHKKKKLDFTRQEWEQWADGVWEIHNPPQEAEGLAGGAVFPVELAERFIRMYSQPGDLILDPFLGTGTTLLAARRTGRSCIGVEVNMGMKEIIKKKVGWGTGSLTEEVRWLEV